MPTPSRTKPNAGAMKRRERPSRGPASAGPLAVAVATRIALAGLAWFSLRIFPRFPLYPEQLPDSFLPAHPALDGWARWDAAHYIAVARFGYGAAENPSPHGGLGFFPLYPLLMRGLVGTLRVAPTPGALALSGIAISAGCFFAAIPLLFRLARETAGDEAAMNAVVLLCLAPFGFYFTAAYSESLFLLLSLASLVLARSGRWRAAACVAGLASGSRLVALALTPALLLLAHRRGAAKRTLVEIAVLGPSGLLLFFAYCWRRFDDPLAYFHAQATWGGWSEHVRFYAELFARHPKEALSGDPRHLVIVLNVALALLFIAALPAVWRRLDPATALFTTLLIVVQGSFTWVSLGRYLLPAVGVYLVAGQWLAHPRWRGWPRDALLLCLAMTLSVLTVLYAHGFWVI